MKYDIYFIFILYIYNKTWIYIHISIIYFKYDKYKIKTRVIYIKYGFVSC